MLLKFDFLAASSTMVATGMLWQACKRLATSVQYQIHCIAHTRIESNNRCEQASKCRHRLATLQTHADRERLIDKQTATQTRATGTNYRIYRSLNATFLLRPPAAFAFEAACDWSCTGMPQKIPPPPNTLRRAGCAREGETRCTVNHICLYILTRRAASNA
jgi:hypothetical protein